MEILNGAGGSSSSQLQSSSGPRLGRLYSPKKTSARRKTQREYSETEVKDVLEGALASGQDVVQTVRQLLEESSGEEGESCRRAVFSHCVELLNSEQLQSQTAQELVGKLLVEVESLAGSSLVAVAEQLIDGVKKGTVESGRSLELFPKLLSVIAAQPIIRYQRDGGGGAGQMEGAEFKSHLLNSLCSCKWSSSSVLHVANMCRDIPMSQEEMQFLIEKILRVMVSLPYSELPPLAYQLLVLSTRGHKSLVLEGIQSLFNQLDRRTLREEEDGEEGVVSEVGRDQRELLQSEGTVILHVTFALKQDQELGKEFVKGVKVVPTRLSTSSLSSFSIALALSVARIHRFEDAVFDSLKAVILKSFKDEDRSKASKWMHDVFKDIPDVEKLILQTVEHSKCGWDHVVEGVVMLGFNLMDSCAPKTSSPQLRSPQHRACCLGSKILKHCFKAHSLVHGEVISQLINRILTNASSYVSHYISLLSDVVAMTPQVALDSLPQLREAFSYLSVLPPTPATDLLNAVLPLVQFSSSVRDSLLLVLRKSLFSRQVDVRKIAVGGYLLLLKKFTVLNAIGIDSGNQMSQASSSSQFAVEVHGFAAQMGFQALCLELLGTLKRSLSQQYEVKATLYQGLYEVFCGNPKLAEPIVELLLNQLMVYYERESDATPPVRLGPCITTSSTDVHRTEPLDRLLQCLQLCVAKFQLQEQGAGQGAESDSLPEAIEEAQEVLGSLVDRMTQTDLEDFELDRSADFSTSSSVGQKNRIFAKLVMGMYETLLEYTFSVGDFSSESCECCLRLFHCFQKVSDMLTEKSGSSTGSKRGHAPSSAAKRDHCNLSLQFVASMLHALFVDTSPNHQQPLTVLRDSQAFGKYILNSALHQIHQVQAKGVCDGAFQCQTEKKMLCMLCSLGRPLFRQLEAGGGGGLAQQGRKEKGKTVPVLCLEGLSLLLQTVASRYPGHMPSFLAQLNPQLGETVDRDERIHFFIKHFQGVMTGVLGGCNREWGMREVQIMISVMTCLTSHLDSDSQQLGQVCEWTLSQCKEQNVDDNQVAKALVSLLLTVTSRHKGTIKTLRKLAQDVHYHLGDIDEDIELEFRPHFAIVNPRTAASSILGLVYSHVEQALSDADWLIARLKTELTTTSSSDDSSDGTSSQPALTQAEGLCSSLCERMMSVVVACSELAQSAVMPGAPTEGLLKTVTKLYATLANLAKYYVSLYASLFHVMSNFRKLVEMVGTHLSQQVYALISYIQATQTLPAEQQDKKKGGKGKGKAAASGKTTVRREIQFFPSLIFAMEQFEKFLIQLSKKSKVNLMETFKRSTSRDFRINHQAVDAILNEEEEEEGEMEGQGERGVEGEVEGEMGVQDGREEGLPRAKRLKL